MPPAVLAEQTTAPESLGQLVRRLRRRLGLSQVKLAELSGCSRRWVLDLEKGLVVDIRLSDCQRLAAALQVDERSLLDQALATAARRADEPHGLRVAKRPNAGRAATAGGAPRQVAAQGPVDPERLLESIARPRLVDDCLVDQLQVALDQCVQRLWDGPPGRLSREFTAQLATLRPLLGECRRPAAARRLLRLTAEAATLAAVTALHLDNRGEARAHLQLAEMLALEADDGVLVGHALINRRALFSSVPYGGQGGHPPTALALLDQAERAVGRRAPPLCRAWLYASRAEEHAVLGNELAAEHDLERAGRAIEEPPQPHSPFFKVWDANRLAGFRGSCALFLNRFHDAATTLEDALCHTSTALVSQYSNVLTDLAASYAAQGHLDHAAVLLDRSLTFTSGVAMNLELQRILGVRRRCIPRSAQTQALSLLDERLQYLASWTPPSPLLGEDEMGCSSSTEDVRGHALVELTNLGGP